jgi:prevent-host-death family protein
MNVVGVREMKSRLTHYLNLARSGETVVVTDRNEPVAVLHGLGQVEPDAGPDEILASQAHGKRLRIPSKRSPFPPVARARGGRKGSELVIEERR